MKTINKLLQFETPKEDASGRTLPYVGRASYGINIEEVEGINTFSLTVGVVTFADKQAMEERKAQITIPELTAIYNTADENGNPVRRRSVRGFKIPVTDLTSIDTDDKVLALAIATIKGEEAFADDVINIIE